MLIYDCFLLFLHSKDADTWKAKYLAARKRQLELEPLTSQYAALLAQYQAVLDVATITSDADKNRADVSFTHCNVTVVWM